MRAGLPHLPFLPAVLVLTAVAVPSVGRELLHFHQHHHRDRSFVQPRRHVDTWDEAREGVQRNAQLSQHHYHSIGLSVGTYYVCGTELFGVPGL